MPVRQTVPSVKDALKEQGVRLTRQRQILLDILNASAGCETFLLTRAKDPKLNRVTVYRTLKMLKKAG